MWPTLKRLSLGLGLIAAASAILLYSDRKSRINSRPPPMQIGASASNRVTRVALIQHASQPVLNDGVSGILAALAESGFTDGKNLSLRKFNAEGDMPTANSIAKNVTGGDFDLILTASTLSLQTVANANKAGKALHVFSLVTDPYGAGVGINRTNHLDHPRHLVGYGTMQPVARSFKIARSMNPQLKRVGVVWNPTESNSEAQVKLARLVCQELGIELLEATVDNSSGVFEAANSVVSRGAEAIWMDGDVMVLTAAESVINAGRRGGIPVFTVIPPHAERGALFDLGANYFEVGHAAGKLAADLLNGRDPASVAVDNLVPELLIVNKLALQGLKQQWQIPDDILSQANEVIDETGKHLRQSNAKTDAAAATPATFAPLPHKKNIHLIGYVQVLDVEEAEQGIFDGLKIAGLVEGRDYEIKRRNAQGDMATISGLVDAALTDGADLIITLSTPTLQAAMRRVSGRIPIIFTYCASGVAAGAGKTESDHLPNVTGVQTTGAYDDMGRVVLECLPNAKRVGTLFSPSEVNMVFHKEKVEQALKKIGLELVAVPAETSAEVADAATALCQRGIDAICQIPGNLTAAAFPSIARAAQTARVPVFASQSSQAHAGAAVVLARDYHDAAIDTAAIAARVLRGESPANIPFETFGRTKIILNRAAIRQVGLNVPPSLEKRAGLILDN